jgi:hypothetical protein
MIPVGEELRNERQKIVNQLKGKKLIKLEKHGNFSFIGDYKEELTQHYVDFYKNF